MRKLLFALFSLAWLSAPALAMTNVNPPQVVNGPVASTSTYVIDLKAYGIDYLSEQINYSTASISTYTFVDGYKSTATITLSSAPALVAMNGQDTITVSSNSALSPVEGVNTLTISSNGTTGILSGSTLTVAGFPLYPGTHWTIAATSSDSTKALNTAINTYVPNVRSQITPVDSSTISIYCVSSGAFCNNYTITSSTVAILVGNQLSTSSFSGGVDNSTINVNGIYLTQGVQWTQAAVASNTAISIASAIQKVPGFTASTVTTTSVQVKCASSGTFCNNYTLGASTTALTIGGSNFIGGQDNAYININGVSLTQGRDWTAVTYSTSTPASYVFNSTATMVSISSAINNSSALNNIVTSSTGSGNVVASTSVFTGVNNWNIYASTSGLTISSWTYLGGLASNISTVTNTINISTHGMPTGYAVVFTSVTGTVPAPLVGNVTYYVIDPIPVGSVVPDPNRLQLAATSTGAAAGLAISITTPTASGGGVFKLAPIQITGNAAFQWQQSNDGVNWSPITTINNNVSIASVTFSSSLTPTTTFYDFGNVNASKIRLSVTAPLYGAFNITATGSGKRQGN